MDRNSPHTAAVGRQSDVACGVLGRRGNGFSGHDIPPSRKARRHGMPPERVSGAVCCLPPETEA
ncbi:hypothetical protein Rhow_005359 [Rhodococcus wratislaviensis]|uniref:Uncharacterized protein n=1 Tax=Rhodococcus wratislaviensis TaxID=44752 RepID=A0A402CDM8_RHOWR|nr:hypothetical protein Rhow_005359 [Rhodococcus wratislaviensis]